jgi:uncharacterized protein (DUF58 family)
MRPDATTPSLHDLTPEQALRSLELTVTRRLDGLLHGDYLGLLPGPGSELAEAREYRPGTDDVRRMDWSITARTTVPHVRDVVADRELETWAVVDASASMDFGTALLEKRDLAVAAVAAVGLLTARTGNRIGAHVVTGGTIRRIPARTGRPALLALLHALLAAPRTPAGPAGASLADAVLGLHRSARRRGLAVVVSDFLDGWPSPGEVGDPGPPPWEVPLRRLGVRHQVLAVEVVDPRELDLPDVGLLTVVDPETGRTREVPTGSRRFRERYSAAAVAQRTAVAAALRRSGAVHLVLRTDRDWVRDIVRHVAAQRRLVRAAAAPGPRPGGAGGGTT